jgi:hypothetical protein
MMKAASSLIMAVVVGTVCVACGGMTLEEETAGPPTSTALAREVSDDSFEDTSPWVVLNNGGIVITRTRSPGKQCGTRTCFHIEADKNISHVFLDFGDCNVGRFKVLARTPFTGEYENVTDRLKTQGGPCQELDMAYRFELRGPDRDNPGDVREADVCVVFYDKIPEVRIGAKAGSTCEADTFRSAVWSGCRQCKKY